ncbi:MAG: hypothetical protein CMK07_13745, partial [Ponticaulis sp.]|nr:hypothetical protein [Ponticaulis sp.]
MLTRERLAQARLDVTTDALADLNFRLSGNTTPVPSQSALPAGALFASSSADTSSAESAETVAATSGPSIAINAQTLTFEDFDTDANGGGPVLTEYANLTWSNAVVIAPADFPYTNAFPNGLTSGTNLVANKFAANAVEITSSSDFNFVSANFISAARDGMTITMEFFDDGVSVGAAGFNIDTFGPVNTPFVAVNSIDRIVITASGGTLNSNYDPALNNTFFGIDDLVVETTGEIRGQLFDDVNGNGVREGTEARLEGRTVYIDANGNGLLDEGEQTAITASNGIYRFQDLLPDTYIIRQILPESHETTSPTPTFFSHYLQESGNDLNGPSHEWSTIVGVGTAVTLGDDSSALVTLPFTFEFWGQEETQVYISSNGFLTFDGADTTDVTNTDLPNAALGEPNGMIAPFWDDLNPVNDGGSGEGYVYYHSNSERTVIWYNNVQHWPTNFEDSAYDFQIVIYATGEIRLNYRNMEGDTNSATIGVQDSSGDNGLLVNYNYSLVEDEYSILINRMPSWLEVSPLDGTVAPDDVSEVFLNVYSTGLLPGEYSYDLEIKTNDYENALITIPIFLNVLENSCGGWSMGDLNQDNVLNVLDVTIIINIALELIDSDECQTQAADLNGDGVVNIADYELHFGLPPGQPPFSPLTFDEWVSGPSAADFNGDGIVEFFDFDIFVWLNGPDVADLNNDFIAD